MYNHLAIAIPSTQVFNSYYSYYDVLLLCVGHKFRVVILSVVRTHHSINKDSVHKCGFYTEKRVLNTAFTRVQSLIITAADPLSLITRGHMSCRLFWASYLSQSLSDEECDQLSKEFVGQVGKVDQNSEEYELYSILIKDQVNIPDDEEYYHDGQIPDDLTKQCDTDTMKQQVVNNCKQENSTNVVRINVSDTLAIATYIASLAWPDPIFMQGCYRLQYKLPAQKGSGLVHRPD